jgi:hypothetical protein
MAGPLPEVVGNSLDEVRAPVSADNSVVAIPAKEATDFKRFVVMIYCKPLVDFVLMTEADRTPSGLLVE